MKQFKNQGFSLVELAIVITIIAIILGMSASGLKSQLGNSEVYSTQQRIDAVKIALENYRTQYGKYPCPSVPTLNSSNASYGIASTNCYTTCPSGFCVANAVNGSLIDMAQGSIPFVTLGISQELSKDAFGNKFTYAVDARFTQDENRCETNGNLTVRDYVGNDMSTKATYVIASHGSDIKGGYAPERGAITIACDTAAKDGENCNNDKIFRMAAITKSNANTSYYDDIIAYGINANYKSCPAGLVNCQVWYDAADKCTILTDSPSTNVLNLYDKSANGYTASQATVANRPDYNSSTLKKNGINTIDFNLGDVLTTGTFDTSKIVLSNYTYVTVFTTSATNSHLSMIASSGGWERYHGMPVIGSGTPAISFNGQFKSYMYNASGQEINSTIAYNDNRPHFAITTVGTTAPGQRMYIDGTLMSATTAPTSTSYATGASSYYFLIGTHGGWSGNQTDFNFLEYLYFDKELTTQERKSLEQYLAKKWGVNY